MSQRKSLLTVFNIVLGSIMLLIIGCSLIYTYVYNAPIVFMSAFIFVIVISIPFILVANNYLNSVAKKTFKLEELLNSEFEIKENYKELLITTYWTVKSLKPVHFNHKLTISIDNQNPIEYESYISNVGGDLVDVGVTTLSMYTKDSKQFSVLNPKPGKYKISTNDRESPESIKAKVEFQFYM